MSKAKQFFVKNTRTGTFIYKEDFIEKVSVCTALELTKNKQKNIKSGEPVNLLAVGK